MELKPLLLPFFPCQSFGSQQNFGLRIIRQLLFDLSFSLHGGCYNNEALDTCRLRFLNVGDNIGMAGFDFESYMPSLVRRYKIDGFTTADRRFDLYFISLLSLTLHKFMQRSGFLWRYIFS